jgi:acyl-CoA synthetase (AMP-forming)/AMP-acid ligase II
VKCDCLWYFPGLPKPVYISQTKALSLGCGMMSVNISCDDVLYTTLPLYHSAGGGLGLYALFLTGKIAKVDGI